MASQGAPLGYILFQGINIPADEALQNSMTRILALESELGELKKKLEESTRKAGRKVTYLTEKRGVERLPRFSGEKGSMPFKEWRSKITNFIAGISPVNSSARIICETWAWDVAHRAAVWYDRVPSPSNPADPGSPIERARI